ncbi:serine hydrolase [Aliikangiella sp. IMCC44359]|uniref:serine hydrolase n=1 Tax=Aliikangiella sp. IMCC44359 TaxID=3459125 RepID=UPI00403A843D
MLNHSSIKRTFKLFFSILLLLPFIQISAFELTQSQLKELDQFINKALKDSGVPGVGVAVVKDDKVILTKGYGVKRIGTKNSVDENTLFSIASNSKAFTATAVGILVDRKKLDWNDRVKDYLPYFELHDKYASSHMNIVDILAHRLGYRAFSGDILWYDTTYKPEEIIRRFKYVKPDYQFRSNFGYSNMGYITAGEVVAQVSGKTWQKFVETEIFKPLGMKNSVASYKKLKRKKKMASPHYETIDESGNVIFRPLDWHHNDAIDAAGSIITSPKDITRWMQLQLNRGTYKDKQIFSENVSNTMWTAHNRVPLYPALKESPSHLMSYGMGVFLKDHHGKLMVTHSGSVEGMTSRIALIPETKLGVAVFTNSTAPLSTQIAHRIIATYLNIEDSYNSATAAKKHKEAVKKKIENRNKALGPITPNTKPAYPLSEYAGTYHSKMYGNVVVTHKNGKLNVAFEPSPMLTGQLTHRHYDVFNLTWDNPRAWINGGTAHFVSNSSGQITEIKFNVPNDDIWFYEPQFLKVNSKDFK